MGEQREDASLGGEELYMSGKDEVLRSSASIPVPVDACRNADHHSAHTILDACDGDGLIISPKDPATFFLTPISSKDLFFVVVLNQSS